MMMRISKKSIYALALIALIFSITACREKDGPYSRPDETINIKFDHDTSISIYENQTYILDANTGDSSSTYSWGSPVIIINTPGYFSIDIVTDTLHETYSAYFYNAEPTLFYPNSFSPNNDGSNDYWQPYGISSSIEDYSLKIYDSQHHIVFKTDQFTFNGSWDGTVEGKACPAGNYYYVVKYKSLKGEKRKDSGMLELIR
jgi:gliding motility-associated-like protein